MAALELVIDPGVAASAARFFRAGQDALTLLDEVADDIVEWVVQDLALGSAAATITAPRDRASVGDAAITAVVRGLQEVAARRRQPAGWTPDAVAAARSLSQTTAPSAEGLPPSHLSLIADRTSMRVDLDARLAANLAELRPAVRTTPGAVRGRLTGLNVSRGNRASLRAVDGHIVRATFESDLTSRLKDALLRDVSLSGIVRKDDRGRAFHIKVSEVEVLGAGDDRWVDLMGIDPAFSDGASVADHLDASRGEA
jgi:hypothetical protein